MITTKQLKEAQYKAADMIQKSGIMLGIKEISKIEVVDFGLNNLEKEGVQVFTMVNTERIAAKILVLFPNQTEPEHWHPKVGDDPGKEETVRIIAGTVYFYIPGEDTKKYGFIPEGKDAVYTCRHELVMKPGDQITLPPQTKHWFQTDDFGAVMYSFSTTVRDASDGFTDPHINRTTKIMD
jgi:D-lyxose ketol-isomerase